MNKWKLPVLLMVAFTVVFSQSCKKDDEKEESKDQKGGFFVINEGGFGSANASIGYVYGDWTYGSQLYKKSNDVLLGDVFQSMIEKGDNYYMVINNSSKIEIVNKESLTNEATIENLGSPNRIQTIGSKLFVNDLYGSKLSYFDEMSTGTVNTLDLNGPFKSMQVLGSNLLGVVNGKLVRIDGATATAKDSFDYGAKLVAIRAVSGKGIYGLAKGEEDSLFSVKISDQGVLLDKNFIEKNNKWLSIFRVSNVNNAFYFVNGDKVVVIDLDNPSNVKTVAVPSGIKAVYGFDIHPQTGEFYFCDAKDYVKNGMVYHTNKSGVVLDEVEVGINPNSCFFN